MTDKRWCKRGSTKINNMVITVTTMKHHSYKSFLKEKEEEKMLYWECESRTGPKNISCAPIQFVPSPEVSYVAQPPQCHTSYCRYYRWLWVTHMCSSGHVCVWKYQNCMLKYYKLSVIPLWLTCKSAFKARHYNDADLSKIHWHVL